MNNLADKLKQKLLIICRNAKREVIGAYESIADAANDFLIDESEVFEAISSKKQLLGSGFWSREKVFILEKETVATVTTTTATTIDNRQLERGKHKHPGTSVSVVQLDYNTMSLIARFNSMYDAYLQTGARNISKCCKGIAQSSGGFKWMFESEYEQLINS